MVWLLVKVAVHYMLCWVIEFISDDDSSVCVRLLVSKCTPALPLLNVYIFINNNDELNDECEVLQLQILKHWKCWLEKLEKNHAILLNVNIHISNDILASCNYYSFFETRSKSTYSFIRLSSNNKWQYHTVTRLHVYNTHDIHYTKLYQCDGVIEFDVIWCVNKL